MEREAALRKATDALLAAKRIVVASHLSPDGDAIGSTLALGLALEGAGKEVVFLNVDPVPFNLLFLPGSDRLVRELPPDGRYDLACLVDCGDFERLGLEDIRERVGAVLNIDHHRTNTLFGDINFVDPATSATGEIVYDILAAAGWPATPEIAVSIFTAIVTDTGHFRYSNSSPKALRVAAEMIEAGADPELVNNEMDLNQPLERMHCLALVLGTLGFSSNGRAAHIHVTREMMEKTGAKKDHLDGFVDWPRAIRGVEVSLFLKEEGPDRCKISLRSKGRIDVASLAESFGGGGHPNASGFSLDGNVQECLRTALAAVDRVLS